MDNKRLFQGVPEEKRQRFESIAIEQPLPLSAEQVSDLTPPMPRRTRDTEFAAELRDGMFSLWKRKVGCDMVVFVRCSSSNSNELLAEFKDLPVYFYNDGLAHIRVHTVVLAAVSSLFASVVNALGARSVSKKRPRVSSFGSGYSSNSNGDDLPPGTSLVSPDEVRKRKNGDTSIEGLSCFCLNSSYIEGAAFFRAIRYVYSGALNLSENVISETLRAFHYLGITSGIDVCVEYLLGKLQPCNALSICALGNLFNCGKLEELADDFLNKHFTKVTKGVEWKELTSDVVGRLLVRDNLKCDSEASVLEALYAWAKAGNTTTAVDTKRELDQMETDREEYDEDPDDDDDDDEKENRVEEFSKMLANGSIRFAHLSDEEIEAFSKRVTENPTLCRVWTRIISKELEIRRKRAACVERTKSEEQSGGNAEEEEDDVEGEIPNLRRYSMVNGSVVLAGKNAITLEGHDGYVYAVTASPSGCLVSGSRDQTIRVWDLNSSKKTLSVLDSHMERVFGLLFLSNGKMASCSFDQTIKIWDPATWTCENTLTGHDGWVVALAECAGKLISGAADNKLKVWNTNTWECEKTIEGHTDHVYGVCRVVDPETKKELLASGSQDQTIKLWDPSDGWREIKTLRGHKDAIRSLKQCGRFLASASADRTIRLWRCTGPHIGKSAGTLIGHSGVVETLVTIPREDSEQPYLASASRDRSIRIWDTQTQSCVKNLVGHRNWVKSLHLMPDGKLASGSADGTVKVWDLS
mmetsp:Transcript_17513/g.28348  ORF Transcript_17513/g.28348 Transcript_17513/m.28348 type:complete len:751 (+) Transcript_17513:140-2392(+)|eukprot:CAMPEP_0203762900 /NCGR_PEP_ID=MMETSP0098-20131031/15682_1 /ASSEMBLY_ACC=CAM_ASM_000208 /TAXON_ID=96639 /ORGANISM=" , Strain NY0313808BC1" /LENGTH=750 /DNA_ID=CAMNT_0050657497 /DNA_START=150 /DNA_END=2402 /DNA_ORIENTATION=-